jgi:hypothetical protein
VRKLFTIALLFCGVLTSLHATVLSGTFTLDGTVVITNTGLIEWISNTSVANQATISAGTQTGTFVGTGNQTVNIHTLNEAPGNEPINSSFTNFDFIDFPADPTFPALLANFIPDGSGTPANCSTNPGLAVANQTCTLTSTTAPPSLFTGGSPYTFFNTESSSGGKPFCCTSSATWNISGVTSDGQSIWSGEFNATFVNPYQTVLANFVANGQVTDAYSGDFTVTITPVPEPTTIAYVSGGLALLWLGKRRRKA